MANISGKALQLKGALTFRHCFITTTVYISQYILSISIIRFGQIICLGFKGSMPLKHDPTVDLITAKLNKHKSISAGKVKEEEEKKEIRSKRLEVVVVCRCGSRRGVEPGGAMNVCSLPKHVDTW